MFKKRLFNLLITTALLLSSAAICQAKTVTFAVASGTQYSAETNPNHKNYTLGSKVLRGFVDRINENNYDFVIFLGDNINKSQKKTLNSFLNVIKGINVPYYLVMGDQDVHKISGIAKPDYLQAVTENSKYQTKKENSFVFYPNKELAVIVLDNVSTAMPSTHGAFTEKTLKWLDATLIKNKKKKVIIFQHVPYIEPYEKYSHSLLEKTDYAAIIKRHENVLAVISGHYNQDYMIKDEKGIYHICAPAMVETPFDYQEITVKYDKTPFSKTKNFKIEKTLKPAI